MRREPGEEATVLSLKLALARAEERIACQREQLRNLTRRHERDIRMLQHYQKRELEQSTKNLCFQQVLTPEGLKRCGKEGSVPHFGRWYCPDCYDRLQEARLAFNETFKSSDKAEIRLWFSSKEIGYMVLWLLGVCAIVAVAYGLGALLDLAGGKR